MSTLYECLREARLEQFYPAFRANGITRSEALINLGMPEFSALGITGAEDKRRLIELVNIIKSVHTSGFSDNPVLQRNAATLHYPNSSTAVHNETSSVTGRASQNNGRGHGRSTIVDESAGQHNPRTQRMERNPVPQDSRVPNFSVASYLEMLEYMSESSDSEIQEERAVEEQQASGGSLRNSQFPLAVRSSVTRAPIERVKHLQAKGYNYGVIKMSTPSKSRSSRSNRPVGEERIKVCVRKRPLTRRELRAKEEDIVIARSTTTLSVNESKLAVDLKPYTLQHEFVFDEVFDELCSNEDVYIRALRPLISCIFSGGTATCFAYGQTGAGKTHTMLGNENVPGLYLLAGQDIFAIIHSGQYGHGLRVWVSFFEIYCGQLFDLLNRRNRLHAREDGARHVCIAGLTETEATSVNALCQTLEYGNSVRSKGATGVNPDSSRSHAILQLDIRNNEDIKVGKISFIDLAGSERASDVTDMDKQTRLEGAEINQSLLALKECIRSIDQDCRHTPFRQSKLTHILKDSFVGNSRTCMIANISPTQAACENTLNTLRYADRVKELKRDSIRNSAVGQAMNLLMNIPPTAPFVFHPSNIQSCSTPMRAPPQPHHERTELDLDPSESPIRGHSFPRRLKTGDNNNPLQQDTSPVSKSRTDQFSTQSSQPKLSHKNLVLSSRSSQEAVASAASQGSHDPPPDASPSESDYTDTDSCNVTNPTYTIAQLAGAQKQLTVAQSTDTELEFPTSDFNNFDEINDLNRPDTRPTTITHTECPKPLLKAVESSAAASAEAFTTSRVKYSVAPIVLDFKPVVYKCTATEPRTASQSAVGTQSEVATVTNRDQTSDLSSPALSKPQIRSLKKQAIKELMSSDNSDDSEALFAEEGASVKVDKAQSGEMIMNKTLIQPPHADSTDLTKFTQQVNLKPLDSSSQNSNALTDTLSEHNLPTYTKSESGTTVTNTSSTKSTVLNFKTNRPRSPTKQSLSKHGQSQEGQTSPANKMKNNQEKHTSSFTDGKELPKPKLKSSMPSKKLEVSNDLTEYPQYQLNTNDPENAQHRHPTNVSKHSDAGKEGRRRRRKSSDSPTGEVSDDSTDSIRASLSDQGNYYRESVKSGMRKERSDPMLALDLQRKKHTLPNPENITKKLNRSGNTSKSLGLSQGPGGWKVIHSELPIHHVARSGECLIEPGSLSSMAQRDLSPDSQDPLSANAGYALNVELGLFNWNQSGGAGKQSSGSQQQTEEVMSSDDLSKMNLTVVTEELVSGAVFSPIHPQPVTCVRTTAQSLSSVLLQPTPVTFMTGATGENIEAGRVVETSLPMHDARQHIVSAHEDQLATITSLCKYEMRLLLNAKKVSGKKGFDDYLRRVNDILQQKMTAILELQGQISQYRSRFLTHNTNSLLASSAATSISESVTQNEDKKQI